MKQPQRRVSSQETTRTGINHRLIIIILRWCRRRRKNHLNFVRKKHIKKKNDRHQLRHHSQAFDTFSQRVYLKKKNLLQCFFYLLECESLLLSPSFCFLCVLPFFLIIIVVVLWSKYLVTYFAFMFPIQSSSSFSLQDNKKSYRHKIWQTKRDKNSFSFTLFFHLFWSWSTRFGRSHVRTGDMTSGGDIRDFLSFCCFRLSSVSLQTEMTLD